MKKFQASKLSICDENLSNCSFYILHFLQGAEHTAIQLEQHILLFLLEGHIRISSNISYEEYLYPDEIMFIPRGSDYHVVALSDTTILMHYFNNTVCHIENCILSFLYTHKHIEPQPGERYFFSKLTVCGQLSHLMDGVGGYISDETYEPALWSLKHKELIWLFTKYYKPEELRLFFHPMTDEDVPFKSLVLAHYRKTEYTDILSRMCGYKLYTFRRLFKKEFGISAHKWLTKKRAELIRYRLSFEYIPLSDIIEEFHFSSPQQFTRFCKDNLGGAPTILRQKYRDEVINANIAKE